MRALLQKLLPRSLAGRVFVTLGLAVLVFVVAALGLFYRIQFLQRIEDSQDTAATLVEVASQAVEESAVIGDYDTVKRTLSKMLFQSPFKSASFIDVAGGVIRVDAPRGDRPSAPAWLRELIGAKLYDINRVAAVGGHDYGVIRLSFDESIVAGQLWSLIVQSASLAALFFAASLLLMRAMLKRWLEHLGRLHAYEDQAVRGAASETASFADAPIEIQEAIRAVNRTAESMRSQFGERIDFLMNSLVQHKSAMDQAAIVCELDVDGRLLSVNDQFVRATGLQRDALIGLALSEVGRPAGAVPRPWVPARTVWNGEVVMAVRGGTMQWYRTLVPIFDAHGGVDKYICIDIDITERKEFEQAIVENAERQTLVAAFGHKALEANSLEVLFGEALACAAQGLGVTLAALFELDGDTGEALLRVGLGWPPAVERSRYRIGAPAGAQLDAEALPDWSGPLREAHGVRGVAEVAIGSGKRLYGSLGVYSRDPRQFGAAEVNFLKSIANVLATAIERHDARRRLTHLAQYDSLTQLPNRRHLLHCLEEAIDKAARMGEQASVMFIDLDRFKNVNDMLGHAAGDQLLVQAARRLRACMRSCDVVGRLGGDEFAVVLPQVAAKADLAALAATIVEVLEKPFTLQEQQVFVSASVGIASYPADGESADLLLQNADTAMYGAKKNGRNSYQVYLPEMNQNTATRLQLESELRLALERRQFVLHYQPKARLGTGEVSGLEALLRWRHPERGLVSPLEFIGLLEDTGLIIPVGEWVIGEVCRQIVEWQAQGATVPPVAINLSARQFQQADLDTTIGRIVRAAGVDPCLLEFELTESMLMANPEAAVATLARIKAQGMRLSVDDFGTGYSSLGYLKRFPIDALKIDRTFIHDLPGDRDDAAITRAVVSMAHNLHLRVVAEGVETMEQAMLLQECACDEVQGYFLGRPRPAGEFEQIMADARRFAAARRQAGNAQAPLTVVSN